MAALTLPRSCTSDSNVDATRMQRLVEEAAHLAGVAEVHQQDREHLRLLAIAPESDSPPWMSLDTTAQRFLQRPGLGLLREDREGREQRESGADHGGELAAHDGEVFHLDLAAAAEQCEIAC